MLVSVEGTPLGVVGRLTATATTTLTQTGDETKVAYSVDATLAGKLGELQAARKDQSSLMMSPEQQAEVQKFLDAQVRIRQELRNVRRNLDRDIDNLGTTLKILNIALVPILLTALALGAVVVKRRRKARA